MRLEATSRLCYLSGYCRFQPSWTSNLTSSALAVKLLSERNGMVPNPELLHMYIYIYIYVCILMLILMLTWVPAQGRPAIFLYLSFFVGSKPAQGITCRVQVCGSIRYVVTVLRNVLKER